MVTLEEQHSTRGRAHMLFELLQGEVVRDGWQDEDVKRALDLCLSCKACKSECPTNVDIATYRAEFLAHYYDGRRRPLHAYAFGMVDRWLRIAALAPTAGQRDRRDARRQQCHKTIPARVARAAAAAAGAGHVPSVGRCSRASARLGGHRRRSGRPTDVILWVDTFNNSFHPETSQAALEVLQSAGFSVTIPRSVLCCGRPLYDFGLLDRAKSYLRTIMHELGEEIDAGVRWSCSSQAARLSSATSSAICFRTMRARPGCAARPSCCPSSSNHGRVSYQPPRLAKRVLLHGHCHQKALMKMGHEESLLRKMGVTVDAPDSGCCGMAGAFGFEADKFEVSQAIGERVLLPAVAKGVSRDADRVGRVQLSGADRTSDRPAASAPGGGAEAGER